ncbi:MAG: transposase [Bacteroidetes bacterium]|nr:transposase [Bacteroidota bacterium]
MNFSLHESYHVYNRGNNRYPIFFNDENYLFFLKKMHHHLKPCCDILCWCLMPNHFHLILHANEESCNTRLGFGGKEMQELSYSIGKLLSSYSQAINKQNKTTGSLFQQKTKSKLLITGKKEKSGNYLINAMHYCHRNPWKAGLVKRIEDWPYTSFPDYCGLRKGILCNKVLLMELTGYDEQNFYRDSYGIIDGFDGKDSL